MLKANIYGILFLGWLMLITFLSLFSFSGLDTDSIQIPYADKVTHFGFYFGYVVLGCLFLWERKRKKPTLILAIAIMVFGAVAYGSLMELLQYAMTDDRVAEPGDVLANSAGACSGGFVIWWYFSKKEPLKWKF